MGTGGDGDGDGDGMGTGMEMGLRTKHTFWALALMYARKALCNVPEASAFGLFLLDGLNTLGRCPSPSRLSLFGEGGDGE